MSRRRRRSPRRPVAAVLGLLTIGALLGMAAPAPAHAPTLSDGAGQSVARTASGHGDADADDASSATPKPTGTDAASSGTSAVELTVAVEQGGTVRRGSAMTADAQVANGTDALLDGGTVTLWALTEPITDRRALTTWTKGSGRPHDATTLGSTRITPVEPGATASTQIEIGKNRLKVGDAKHAHVVAVGATLTVDGDSAATARSTVLLEPKHGDAGSSSGTRLAVAMPITVPATADGLVSSKDLAAYTAPNGILSRDVDGLLGHPDVAIGLDPMILASIRALGTSAPQSARAWLHKLLQLPNDVFPLRFGDADPSAQAQAGLDKLLTPGSFAWAMRSADFRSPLDAAGETPQPSPTEGGATPTPTSTDGADLPTTDELLAWPYTLSGIAWPAEGGVSSKDFATFAASGLTTAILSSSNVSAPHAAAGSAAPNAAFRSGDETVLTSDDALSTDLRAAVSATSDIEWNAAMAGVNAQLTLLGATAGDASTGTADGTMLATLGRAWPADAARLSSTLDALDRNPRVQPTMLPELREATATPGMKVASHAEPEARIQRVHDLVQTEKQVRRFASVLTMPDLLKGRQRAQLLTLLGSTWLEPSNDWHRAVSRALKAGTTTLSAIRIIPSGAINVASTEAPLPVTVENKLDFSVHIVLSAVPTNGRIEIDGTASKTLQADSRGTVFVPVKATVGNGKARLDLQLYSATGEEIGEPASIPIEVHAEWEGVVAVVLAVLIVGLFGFGLVRNIHKHRATKRAAEAGETADGDAGSDGTKGADGDGDDGPAHPDAVPTPERKPGGDDG